MHLCFPVGGWPSCSSYILGGHVSHRRAPATDVVGVRRFWSQSLNPARTQHSACKRLLQGAGRGPSRMDGRRGHTREPHPHKTISEKQLLLPAIPHEILIVTSLENARSSSEKSTRLGTLQHIPDDEHGPLRGSVGSLPAAVVSDATVQFEATNKLTNVSRSGSQSISRFFTIRHTASEPLLRSLYTGFLFV